MCRWHEETKEKTDMGGWRIGRKRTEDEEDDGDDEEEADDDDDEDDINKVRASLLERGDETKRDETKRDKTGLVTSVY